MSKFVPDMSQKVDLRKWVNPETNFGYDFVEIDRFETIEEAYEYVAVEKDLLIADLFKEGKMNMHEILEQANAFVESFHTVEAA